MKITFIGGGNMATALMTGLRPNDGPHQIEVVDVDTAQRARLHERFGVRAIGELDDAAARCDVMVLATKPQHLFDALQPVAARLRDGRNSPLLLSIAAGIRTEDVARWAGGYRRVIRAMPNTPALIGAGITGLTALAEAGSADRAAAESIMGAVGALIWVDDDAAIDAVTAVSGSGPAYVFYLIEAMLAGAERIGLSAQAARQLTLATLSGATQLAAQSSESAQVLRERVTSKGGTTAAALAHLQMHQVGPRISEAVEAAYVRARAMADELGRQ